ncbi:MAG TPA: hypothetical protein ACFYD7_07225 [Candidatus Wujingus californicus]|uniref:hypothetical protein n=1 Tax=Candidatus Wujingus californicus TaxID=3367618 RepID=UPI001D97C92B|nr:hypothetical protein [Planctomycetota bacterium]
MDVSAKITGITYKPFLCRELKLYDIKNLTDVFDKNASFILNFDKDIQIAVSWWVSAKRTRSYPYARVYDTLGFQGKKVTIIPIFKDEGKEGDRDFLQWDTISLMSLLGVYTIVSYYNRADTSTRYDHKITNQRFDTKHLQYNFDSLFSYQSDALHWNLSQIDAVGKVAEKALAAYKNISEKLNVDMHSFTSAHNRIQELLKGKDNFMNLSRNLAQKAQAREITTIQPKEQLAGTKATLTIKNYLGGYYYFTCDEAKLIKSSICLIEGKHSKKNMLPSTEDIKDGLIKMILFSNLKEVKIGDKEYTPLPILKLTSNKLFSIDKLSSSRIALLKLLLKESVINKFEVLINGEKLQDCLPLITE